MPDWSELAGGAKVDFEDLRDEHYTPSFQLLPPELYPDALFDPARPGSLATGVRSQKSRPDCVGQALAGLIDIQRRLQQSEPDDGFRASGRMLYQLASFYDSYRDLGEHGDPGKPPDGIRTLRAAIKAFHHHGVCSGASGPGAWPEDAWNQTWPSSEQAKAGEQCVLGGYRRLQPVLNHYHSAIAETRAVLVSAMIHDGWFKPHDGRISLGTTEGGLHAFLVIGFTKEGFLVLNSWGPEWGGYRFPGHADPTAGVALWSYEDWARNVADGWVLRLGVPGPGAFAVSRTGAGQAGPAGERRGSMPYRELRGNFLNLSDGRCVDTGAYPTPASNLDNILEDFVAQIKDPTAMGAVIRIPGILDPLGSGFARAVRAKQEFARGGLLFFTCFWCAELAQEIGESLTNVMNRSSLQGAATASHFSQIFEREARGAGRAFWRDILYHARAAAEDAPGRGTFGVAYQKIEAACRDAGKPLHVVTDGAGVLLLDALIESRRGGRIDAEGVGGFTPPASLSMVFPAIPVVDAEKRLLPLARHMELRRPGSARIFVPSPEAEKRIAVGGYPGPVLQLVANAFLDQVDGVAPRMLGMAKEDGLNPRPPAEAIFQPVDIKGTARIEDRELAHDPAVESQVRAVIERIDQKESHTQPGDFPMAKISLEELQRRYSSGDLTPEELQRYFIFGEGDAGPFSVSVEFNPDTVELPADGMRSALFMNFFNETERFARLAKYNARLAAGYSGPRIAAEGDSWFQYPLILRDVIDWVSEDYAVLDTSAAGDLLQNMAARREYISSLRESKAKVLLLSAGGNDLCAGGKLANHLENFDPNRLPADYLKRSYQGLLDDAIGWYERICRDVRGNFPDVTIICHGYDYAIPNHGRWLGRPMQSRGITDGVLQRAIAREMVDQFNRVLRRMADRLDHVEYVDCRNAVSVGGWFDELHPRDSGFGSAAGRIVDAIRRVVGRSAQPRTLAAPDLATVAPQAISLHVGLNAVDPGHYAGWSGALRGCENDARSMKEIADSEGWSSSILLTADATRVAVVQSIKAAAATLKPGGQFLFTNSSHGGQIKDFNGDERTGIDSTLCLFDSQIIDDELYDLWSRFEAGVRIIVVSDSCHSGTVIRANVPGFDTLAGNFNDIVGRANRQGGNLIPRAMPSDVGRRVLEQNESYYRDLAGQFDHVDKRIIMSPQQTNIAASVLSLSACQDEETALDGDNHGVFTQALLKVWGRGRFDQGYRTFHEEIVQEINLPQQRPKLMELPPVDPSFAMQRPFTIWGRRIGAPTSGSTTAARPDQAAVSQPVRRPIANLLIGEGDESDVTPQARGAVPEKGLTDGEVMSRFASYIEPLHLQNFMPEEFLFLGSGHHTPGSKGFGLNSFPPEELWPNIVEAARLIDALRGSLNVPIRILSAYRNEAYNHAIGGVGDSMHKAFRACDIAAEGVAPSRVADALLQMRKAGRFSGGIGRYATFTHVDTRGVDADWGGNGGAKGGRKSPARF